MAELWVRGGALFLGGYALLSGLFYLISPSGYDANRWWVDLRGLPGGVAWLLPMLFGLALVHRAVLPRPTRATHRVRTGLFVLLIGILLVNSLAVWDAAIPRMAAGQRGIGGVWLGMPIPLTLVLAAGVLAMVRRPAHLSARSRIRRGSGAVGLIAIAGVFSIVAALSQMFWFGESDYRRPADAIVVFGCKAYADGKPSQALADRVHTACELYHQGLAPVLVMSGGPVQGAAMHETKAMADYAVSLGVPRSAIVLDPYGLDTQATAANLEHVLKRDKADAPLRILAVSHDYHLPRVKLSFERRGITAYTVPAKIRRGLPSKPYLVARETAAWWYYYVQPLASVGS